MWPLRDTILITSEACEVSLVWDEYDGDDCYDDFRIVVAPRDGAKNTFCFGACGVRALRKMREFLGDDALSTVGGGFRNPDVRTYDWYRQRKDLKLVVVFEGEGVHFECLLVCPVSVEKPE